MLEQVLTADESLDSRLDPERLLLYRPDSTLMAQPQETGDLLGGLLNLW